MRKPEKIEIKVPEEFNFAIDVIDEQAKKRRNSLAIIWTNEAGAERKITYWELSVASSKVANFLQGLGIEKGDKVLVMLPRIPEWWFVMLGINKLGAVAVPSAVVLTPRDIEYRCAKASIKAVITNEENMEKFEQIRDRLNTVEHFILVREKENSKVPEGWIDFKSEYEAASRNFIPLAGWSKTKSTDPMLIYFTSGTTGYPKMVPHEQSYAMAHRLTAELWHDLTPEDIIWTITDTGWAKIAWGAFYGQFYVGATIFVYDYRGRFNPSRVLTLLEKYGITVFCAPPTAYRMLILEDLKRYNFSELRRCTSAGEPLNPEVIEVWKRGTGVEIHEGYGQSETIVIVGNLPWIKPKYGSMGIPIPGFTVDVIGDDLKPLPPGQEGDIAVKVRPEWPIGIFKGYLGDEELNREVFRGDWYITGDRAIKDEDGYFWFVGRADDVIKSSGYRIGPFEVESALLEHPAVMEAAVIGVPDELRGQKVKAFVILAPEYEPSEALIKELQEHVKKITAPYKYPREIEFVKELPKTVSGKIRRMELRERELKKRQQG